MKAIDLDINPAFLRKQVQAYVGGGHPAGRWAAFDYCFAYFQGLRAQEGPAAIAASTNIEDACLHLYSFLASWGMAARGSVLGRTNFTLLEPAIRVLASPAAAPVWNLDIDGYFIRHPVTGNLVLSRGGHALLCLIRRGGTLEATLSAKLKAMGITRRPTDTLVTKIVLGTTGSVPGFDSVLKKRTNGMSTTKTGLRKLFDYHAQVAGTVAILRQRTLVSPYLDSGIHHLRGGRAYRWEFRRAPLPRAERPVPTRNFSLRSVA